MSTQIESSQAQSESASVVDRAVRLFNKYRAPISFGILFLTAWTVLVEAFDLPFYILPTPIDIVVSFQGEWGMLRHMRATGMEALFGWVVGNAIGISLGATMAEFTTIRKATYPYVIMFRSLPIIAFAPLLIIWMGINVKPILAIATITAAFPTLVNSVTGFSSTDQLTLELMRSLDASRWETFRHVKIYDALPYIFSGFKISVAGTLVGAVVGEWLVADSGLGYLIIVANNQIAVRLLFRSLILIGLMAALWFGLIMYTERKLITWGEQAEANQR